MTDTSHGMPLVHRIVQEHKRAVVVLSAVLLLNVLAYALVVRPLRQSVSNVEQSTLAAEQSLAAAKAEYATANGTLTGKARATKELATFYSTVLAQDLSGARRMIYGRVVRLAEESRLQFRSGRYEPEEARASTLTKLKSQVELTGNYTSMRSFIHAIETAPEFVVIENLSLAEGSGNDAALRVNLELSTYFRSAHR